MKSWPVEDNYSRGSNFAERLKERKLRPWETYWGIISRKGWPENKKIDQVQRKQKRKTPRCRKEIEADGKSAHGNQQDSCT